MKESKIEIPFDEDGQPPPLPPIREPKLLIKPGGGAGRPTPGAAPDKAEVGGDPVGLFCLFKSLSLTNCIVEEARSPQS